jgi:cytoskeletal protein RodZ
MLREHQVALAVLVVWLGALWTLLVYQNLHQLPSSTKAHQADIASL